MQLVLVTNVLYQSCMAVSPDQSIQPAFSILIFMGSNIKFNSSDVSIQNDPNLRYIASWGKLLLYASALKPEYYGCACIYIICHLSIYIYIYRLPSISVCIYEHSHLALIQVVSLFWSNVVYVLFCSYLVQIIVEPALKFNVLRLVLSHLFLLWEHCLNHKVKCEKYEYKNKQIHVFLWNWCLWIQWEAIIEFLDQHGCV